MPLGLAAFVSGHAVTSSSAAHLGGLAAARSCIRRRGFTLAVAASAAGDARRGIVLPPPDRAAAAAWFAAEYIYRAVAFAGGRAPGRITLAVATWSPGASHARAGGRRIARTGAGA